MTTAALSYFRTQKRITSKVSSINFPELNWKVICFAGLFVTLLLLIFYVWQVNGLTKGSYLVGSYEKQISQLTEENKNLEVSFAESSFLGQALQKIQDLNFEKAASVKYIQILDNSVAKAK